MGELGEKCRDATHERANKETCTKNTNEVQDCLDKMPNVVFAIFLSRDYTRGYILLIIFQLDKLNI